METTSALADVRARVAATLDEIEELTLTRIETVGGPVPMRDLLADLAAAGYRPEYVSRALSRALSHKRLSMSLGPRWERVIDAAAA